MARMNKSSSITGRPRTRQPDRHSAAIAEALADGLGEWAEKDDSGRPLLFTARQRAAARNRRKYALQTPAPRD